MQYWLPFLLFFCVCRTARLCCLSLLGFEPGSAGTGLGFLQSDLEPGRAYCLRDSMRQGTEEACAKLMPIVIRSKNHTWQVYIGCFMHTVSEQASFHFQILQTHSHLLPCLTGWCLVKKGN